MQFRLVGDAIEVASTLGQVVWRGRPLGYPVKVLIPLPGQDGCIVLCDPDSKLGGHFENVLRIAGDGSVLWRAPLPSSASDDCYTALRYDSDALVAYSWSGHRVCIDPKSGRILGSTFTK